MRSKFYDLFNKLISQKRTDNNSYFSLSEYNDQISKVKELRIEKIGKRLQDGLQVRNINGIMEKNV